jgi:hypothetical protein
MSRMAAAPADEAFDRDVARALSLIGAEPSAAAADALADPAGAARRLEDLATKSEGRAEEARGSGDGEGRRLVLRAAPEIGSDAPGYGPLPVEPVWVMIERGSADVVIAPLRLGASKGAGEVRRGRARAVVVTTEERPCCDAPSCKLESTHASAWLEVGEAPRLLVAEARDVAPAQAVMAAREVAAALARAMGVPLEVRGERVDPTDVKAGDASAAARAGDASAARAGDASAARAGEAGGESAGEAGGEGAKIDAGLIARWAIRSEGDRIVLRDHASRGPREAARRTLLIGLVLLGLAVALWVLFAQQIRAGEQGFAVALGAVAALVSLTSYAFLGVGRFAARYAAESSPLVAMGRDRVIVAPWVSRRGAVDLRPEGRLGAAIPIGEVRGVAVRERDGQRVIELQTDHGIIDALACDRDEVAELFCRALRRSLDQVRHPSAGASAKQRARSRAKAAT